MKLTSQSKTLSYNVFPLIFSLMLLMAATVTAKTFKPTFKPTMEISRATSDIDIDGLFKETAWKNTAWSDNFVERNPGDNIEPLVETKVMVTYNNDNLYVGFICYDDPATLRATMCQRDQYSGNDKVIILMDTYGVASWAYEFHV
ncbi:MAG: hypothetical protein PHU88_09680, partial [candidate division Zixibacteria bacterium]|nr:hypothetical protein [candidate division Zixibacteria bacterium]